MPTFQGISTVHVVCQVDICGSATVYDDPEPGWTTDSIGRLFCPDHPVDTACRICGSGNADGRILCTPCTRGEQ